MNATAPAAEITPRELVRYSRHLSLPEIGLEGQKKLKNTSVLAIGAGGLGSPVGLYLTAAGIGRLGLVDFDFVDETNLQRQVLHSTADVGRSKLESARQRLEGINPHVVLDLHEMRFSSLNALGLVGDYDIVIDGSDNFPTRYLVNDACVFAAKPLVYGAILRFEGQASVFDARRGPCYRCLFAEPPPAGLAPSCAESGVLGVLPGIIGCIQAAEAIKLATGAGTPLLGRLLLLDALAMRFREVRVPKNPECALCGPRPTIRELAEYEEVCDGVRDAPGPDEIGAADLKAKLDRGDDFCLIDVREPHEFAAARIPAARLIPLGILEDQLSTLDRGGEIVVHCKTGSRSARALETLRRAGFARVRHLRGGIAAWRREIEPALQEIR